MDLADIHINLWAWTEGSIFGAVLALACAFVSGMFLGSVRLSYSAWAWEGERNRRRNYLACVGCLIPVVWQVWVLVVGPSFVFILGIALASMALMLVFAGVMARQALR